jgi:hypothetical protein
LGHQVRVFHVLWYLGTFLGVAWLVLEFEKWRRRTQHAGQPALAGSSLARALVVACLALILALVHHLARHWLMLYCLGFLGMLIVAGAVILRRKSSQAAE